jgi:hypothetical protein
MVEGLFRCPHCGQVTTGSEQKVTQLGLSMQMKARAKERKERGVCKKCGKLAPPGETYCSACKSTPQPMTLILIVAGIIVVIMILSHLM